MRLVLRWAGVIAVAGALGGLMAFFFMVQDMPHAESDDSGLGSSAIGQRVAGMAYAASDDFASRLLSAWFAEQCPNLDPAAVRSCATALGMSCSELEGDKIRCTYHGVLRTRYLNADHPRNGSWWRANIKIELVYEPPAPLSLMRTTTAGFEDGGL